MFVFLKPQFRIPAGMIGACIVILAIAATVFISLNKCSEPVHIDDTGMEAKRLSEERLEKLLAESDKKIDALSNEIYEIQIAMEQLQQEVQASVEERNGEHEDIDGAISIDDIDRVLKRGVPGVSGKTR